MPRTGLISVAMVSILLLFGLANVNAEAAEYSRYSLSKDRVDPGYPKGISAWRGVWPGGVDAAVLNPKNDKVYLFKGSEYIRYDLDASRADPGYPRGISAWRGVWSSGVDAAVLNPKNGKVYLFKGSEYIRYDLDASRADPGYPKRVGTDGWLNLRSPISAALDVGRDRVYFFHPEKTVYDVSNLGLSFKGVAPKAARQQPWRGKIESGSCGKWIEYAATECFGIDDKEYDDCKPESTLGTKIDEVAGSIHNQLEEAEKKAPCPSGCSSKKYELLNSLSLNCTKTEHRNVACLESTFRIKCSAIISN